MDFLALCIKGNPLIPACFYNLRITYILNNFVYDEFMNGDRNAVIQGDSEEVVNIL